MSWDPFQCDVLAELGHVLHRQVGVAMPAAAEIASIQVDGGVLASADSAMLARVAHAAGMTTDALQACFQDMPALAKLHGNPAAKRALWPRLRSLRSQHA